MATINITASKEDVININVNGSSINDTIKEENEELSDCEKLYKKLHNSLNRYNSKQEKHWWYEVFIDFDDDFDNGIYPFIKDMPNYYNKFTYCLGYMYMRDNYYSSSDYIDDLNNMLNEAHFKE